MSLTTKSKSRRPFRVPRRVALLGATLVIAIASCAREATAPSESYGRVSFVLQQPGTGLLSFARVRVVLNRADGTAALDTTFDFPASVDSLTVAVAVRLLAGTPAAGEPMRLTLYLMSATGVTLFKSGSLAVTVTPIAAGQPAPPAMRIPFTYVGPGANAARVHIEPRTGTVFAGDDFVFTAAAQDAAGAPIPDTPIVWGSLDVAIASPALPLSGRVTARAPGTARIVAWLLTGQADTVALTVQAR